MPGRGVTSLEGQRTLTPIISTVIMRENGVVIGWGRRYGSSIIYKRHDVIIYLNRHNPRRAGKGSNIIGRAEEASANHIDGVSIL